MSSTRMKNMLWLTLQVVREPIGLDTFLSTAAAAKHEDERDEQFLGLLRKRKIAKAKPRTKVWAAILRPFSAHVEAAKAKFIPAIAIP